MQLNENEMFANRYLLEHLLGRGGFSEVWLVTDTLTELKVALKVYAPGTGMNDLGVKVFSSEFSLVFDLNHNNLLKPSYFDTYNHMPYLVLPYCEQGSIASLVGEISEPEAWNVLYDIASGLEYLHEQDPPVIHQDIKPDNVLIGPTGRYLLTDFGISMKARNTFRQSLQGAGTSIGTLAYMGPERFSKFPMPIKASDIFSLGVTMYELLTGLAPFGEHGGLLLSKGAEVPSMEGNRSPQLVAIIESCLKKDTWERPSASDIKAKCEQYMNKDKQPDRSLSSIPTNPPISTNTPTPPITSGRNRPSPQENRSETESRTPDNDWKNLFSFEFIDFKRIGKWAIALAAVFLVVVIIVLLVNNAKRKEQKLLEAERLIRIEKLYSDFKQSVDVADNLVLRGDTTKDGELFYLDAIKCYQSASEMKEAYKDDFTAFPPINVTYKKKTAETKRDSTFYVLGALGRFNEELEREKPRQKQDFSIALDFFERADRLKPDSSFVQNFNLRNEYLTK
jgi:serine/threonine protein kinase